MKFEWDDNKSQLNYAKHGLSFSDAEMIFSGETITFVDDRQGYGEERLITLGALMGSVVVVVHTPRHPAIRIISMRKANEREKKIYYQRLKET
jgi:uncharacterized DUF497 family protein